MRGFYCFLGKALLDSEFADSVMEAATKASRDKPLSAIKSLAQTECIRINAIEVSEVYRVFLLGASEKPREDDPTISYVFKDFLDEYRGFLTADLDEMDLGLLKNDPTFLEVLSISIFDDHFFDVLGSAIDVTDLEGKLMNFHFSRNEINTSVFKVFVENVLPMWSDLKYVRDWIHDVKWIRPYGVQIAVSKGICWGNISKSEIDELKLAEGNFATGLINKVVHVDALTQGDPGLIFGNW